MSAPGRSKVSLLAGNTRYNYFELRHITQHHRGEWGTLVWSLTGNFKNNQFHWNRSNKILPLKCTYPNFIRNMYIKNDICASFWWSRDIMRWIMRWTSALIDRSAYAQSLFLPVTLTSLCTPIPTTQYNFWWGMLGMAVWISPFLRHIKSAERRGFLVTCRPSNARTRLSSI